MALEVLLAVSASCSALIVRLGWCPFEFAMCLKKNGTTYGAA